MFERLTARVEHLSKRRAQLACVALAERMLTETSREKPGAQKASRPSPYPHPQAGEGLEGVVIEALDEGVIVSGRRIGARFALDPALRWLVARVR